MIMYVGDTVEMEPYAYIETPTYFAVYCKKNLFDAVCIRFHFYLMCSHMFCDPQNLSVFCMPRRRMKVAST